MPGWEIVLIVIGILVLLAILLWLGVLEFLCQAIAAIFTAFTDDDDFGGGGFGGGGSSSDY